MIATVLSFFLLSSNPSLDIIREHRLGTPEGRRFFLTEMLNPYVARANHLNQEIIALSEEVTEKMARLNEMLPILNLALQVNTDFEEIDAILGSSDLLTAEQQEIADRIANLCIAVDQ